MYKFNDIYGIRNIISILPKCMSYNYIIIPTCILISDSSNPIKISMMSNPKFDNFLR